ncbi:hypothetical protein SAY87_004125 [Trapa incisa]|uniref:Wound-responsive family protein n=1 Tax=Trapa incisa TaxID=236973 RepID=A0AAN7JPI0_9MYRT|nr:hypothetical protein SAY87_004125 [Trapa incisa]
MSSTSRAWIAAASVGTVEALKYQGLCRFNQTLRSMHQRIKGAYQRPTFPQTNTPNKKLTPPVSNAVVGKIGAEKRMRKKPEESMRKVMYVSSWGPY